MVFPNVLTYFLGIAISKLVAFSIETGLATALFAFTLVFLFAAFPRRDYFEVCGKCLAKIYSNQLLLVSPRPAYFAKLS